MRAAARLAASALVPRARAHGACAGGIGRDIIEQSTEAFQEFKRSRWSPPPEVQTPSACIVSCADSRVSPSMLLGAAPGEVFTVRNVANLVPPYEPGGSFHGTAAALEFAVAALKVPHVVVLGHSGCGGVRHAAGTCGMLSGRFSPPAAEAGKAFSFVDKWVEVMHPSLERVQLKVDGGEGPGGGEGELLQMCEKESVNGSLLNLLTYPWVRQAVAAGKLKLHGWHYSMGEGVLDKWQLAVGTCGREVLR